MAFRAVHAQWGTVFAHLPDLGRGQAWEAVWKVRPSTVRTKIIFLMKASGSLFRC